jgi:hypothetical protein
MTAFGGVTARTSLARILSVGMNTSLAGGAMNDGGRWKENDYDYALSFARNAKVLLILQVA